LPRHPRDRGRRAGASARSAAPRRRSALARGPLGRGPPARLPAERRPRGRTAPQPRPLSGSRDVRGRRRAARVGLIQEGRPMSSTHPVESASSPMVVIRPTKGWAALRLNEVWEYRELLFFLAWRDVKIRYKQTALGAAWAVLQPLLTMVVFT